MKKDTVIRTALLLLALLNQILTLCGINPLPFSDQQLYEGLSLAATVATSLWAWWKNNSFTKAAQTADVLLEQLKKEDIA